MFVIFFFMLVVSLSIIFVWNLLIWLSADYVNLSVWEFCLSASFSVGCIRLLDCLPQCMVCLSNRMSVCLSVSVCVCLLVSLYIVYFPIRLSASVYVCLPNRMSVCLSACIHVCLFKFICLCVCLSTRLFVRNRNVIESHSLNINAANIQSSATTKHQINNSK